MQDFRMANHLEVEAVIKIAAALAADRDRATGSTRSYLDSKMSYNFLCSFFFGNTYHCHLCIYIISRSYINSNRHPIYIVATIPAVPRKVMVKELPSRAILHRAILKALHLSLMVAQRPNLTGNLLNLLDKAVHHRPILLRAIPKGLHPSLMAVKLLLSLTVDKGLPHNHLAAKHHLRHTAKLRRLMVNPLSLLPVAKGQPLNLMVVQLPLLNPMDRQRLQVPHKYSSSTKIDRFILCIYLFITLFIYLLFIYELIN